MPASKKVSEVKSLNNHAWWIKMLCDLTAPHMHSEQTARQI